MEKLQKTKLLYKVAQYVFYKSRGEKKSKILERSKKSNVFKIFNKVHIFQVINMYNVIRRLAKKKNSNHFNPQLVFEGCHFKTRTAQYISEVRKDLFYCIYLIKIIIY